MTEVTNQPGNGSQDRPLAGIAFDVFGLGVFALQDVIMKLLSGRYPVWEFGIVRAVVAVGIIALILLLTGHRGDFRPRRPGLLILRGALIFASYTSYYLAIATLTLANAVALFFLAPLLVTALSALVLRETVGVRRWIAVLVGFGGILIVVQPGHQTLQPAVFLAVGAAVFYAFSLITTRRIGLADSGATVAMYGLLVFGVISAIGSVAFNLLPPMQTKNASLAFLIRPWALPTPEHLGLMVATGLISALGHFCLSQAYRIAPPSLVSGFEYTYFLWAVLYGYLIWGHVPRIATLVGVAIVFAAGLYVIRREAYLIRTRR